MPLSLATEQAFVTSVYKNVLLRSSTDLSSTTTQNDVNTWANLIVGGVVTESQVATAAAQGEATKFVLPIVSLYEGLYHRAPDAAGLAAWVTDFRSGDTLTNIAQQFSKGTEFTNLFGTGPSAGVFVTALYVNILGRLPDAAGLNAWAGSLGGSGAAPTVVQMANLALTFTQSTEFLNSSSVNIQNWLIGGIGGTYPTTINGFSGVGSAPGQTFTLTTGIDNITSNNGGDTVLGTLAAAGATLNAGDQITFNGGTLKVVDTLGGATNELNGVNVTGPFKFAVQNAAAGVGTYDFVATPGETAVTSVNSTAAVTFTGLGAGVSVTVSGAATKAAAVVTFAMASANGAITVGVDGGANGVTIANTAGAAAAPTTATINSTGAVNGKASAPDVFTLTKGAAGSVTTVTVNATTNLVGGFTTGADFAAAGAALTVSGLASTVDLTQGAAQGNYKTIDASGLKSGGLIINSDAVLTSFVGGGGNNSLLGTAISGAATSINGGGGSANILSSSLINVSNVGIFKNWQILDVTNNTNSGNVIDTSLLSNNGPVTGVQINSTDTGTPATTVQRLAANATISLQGQGKIDAGLTVTHAGSGTNSLAVTFADASGTAADVNTLTKLTSMGDTTMSILSGGATAGQTNAITSIVENDNLLTTITINGAMPLTIGAVSTNATGSATANVASTLTTIDASGDTGGVTITAGGSSAIGTSGFLSTYTGLTIKGGTGKDAITNNAKNGVVIEQNAAGDTITLGGSGGSGTFGTGAGDTGTAGNVNDSFTFGSGAGATGKVVALLGSAVTAGGIAGSAAEQTNVTGVAGGFKIDLSAFAPAAATAVNETAAVTAANALSLLGAENAAVKALAGVGVGYFTFGGDEYLVGVNTAGQLALTAGDAVVHLVGGNFTGITAAAGVVTLA